MGWDDLNWLEDVHMGYEEGEPAIFDRNVNGWVRIPKNVNTAEQSAGSRHDGARIADQVPDVAQSSDGAVEQGLSEVLIRHGAHWRLPMLARFAMRAPGEPLALYVCHCRECRKQSASAFGMSFIVPRAGFRVTKGTPHFWIRNADSGRQVNLRILSAMRFAALARALRCH